MRTLRTVAAEHGYTVLQAPGEIVAGVQTYYTVGSFHSSKYQTYAYDAAGKMIGAFPDCAAALEAIAENSR